MTPDELMELVDEYACWWRDCEQSYHFSYEDKRAHEKARECEAKIRAVVVPQPDHRDVMRMALEALVIAEAGLADIGDADREPGDDVAWCEARAARALPETRSAIAALRAALGEKE